ncbi:carbohydrate ABC transporter permease [Arthrobacter pigmenti]
MSVLTGKDSNAKLRPGQRRKHRRNVRAALLFISPWIFGMLVFTAWPILYSGHLSLTDYDVINDPTFIGFENYAEMLEDPKIALALWNTFIYTIVSVPAQVLISLALAMLLMRVGVLPDSSGRRSTCPTCCAEQRAAGDDRLCTGGWSELLAGDNAHHDSDDQRKYLLHLHRQHHRLIPNVHGGLHRLLRRRWLNVQHGCGFVLRDLPVPAGVPVPAHGIRLGHGLVAVCDHHDCHRHPGAREPQAGVLRGRALMAARADIPRVAEPAPACN